MFIFNEEEIQAHYLMNEAIADVKEVLIAKAEEKIENPIRTVIDFPERSASALYMPSADHVSKVATMKAVTIFPENPKVGKPTTQGVTLVSDATNGEHLALMNASYLTRLRTGALSAIATDYLARKDASVLTAIGTGGMAFEQVLAVLEVRSIEKIILVNPTEAKAVDFKQRLREFGVAESISIEIERDVSVAVKAAHVICCSTRSETPVFDGKDIQPGTHVNGVGSYLPHMREVDFDFIQTCDKIVVDDYHGVTEEAGELIHANEQPNWSYENLHGELKDVVTTKIPARESAEEVTFFKCVGAAYFDLAVAKGVYHKASKEQFGTVVHI